jgi:hypothetical protein
MVENLRLDVSQRFAWLGMDSSVDRLRDQTQVRFRLLKTPVESQHPGRQMPLPKSGIKSVEGREEVE